MNILRYHKLKEIDQYINGLIYIYHKHSIQPTTTNKPIVQRQQEIRK